MTPEADIRYEILPFGSGLAEAERQPEPLTITVTCSPRLGVDQMVDTAVALAGYGHESVPHLAARQVDGPEHLDRILQRLAAVGIADVFLIGGDAPDATGPYASAHELLPLVDDHPLRPQRIGVAAYPEGHPLIDDETLERVLADKAAHADYAVTQMCFDAAALGRWVRATRERGIDLPLYLGLPGAVDRRRLLEVSMRIGVGGSIRFIRKQRGLRSLLGRPAAAPRRLYEVLAPLVGDPQLAIAGLHFFTFNRLADTHAWQREHSALAIREAQDA